MEYNWIWLVLKSQGVQNHMILQKIWFWKKWKRKQQKSIRFSSFFLINFGMCQRITLTSSYNCVVTISNNASKSCSRITNSLFEKSKTFKDATEGKQCIVQYQAHTLFSPMPFCQPNISYREGEWQGVVHLHVMYKTRRNNTNNNKCCVFKSSSYFNFSAVRTKIRTITIDMCFVTRIWQNKYWKMRKKTPTTSSLNWWKKERRKQMKRIENY